MQTTIKTTDQEAIALASCYRLLLQKARERRERLAQETAVTKNQAADNQSADPNQNDPLQEIS